MYVVEELFVFDFGQCGKRRSYRSRVSHERMAVLEEAAALANSIGNLVPAQQGAYRLISRCKALGHGHHVGHDAFLLVGHHGAGSSSTAHDFIEDQVHAVLIAYFPDALEVAG